MQKKQVKKAILIFPNQLFEQSALLHENGTFFLIEEYLFFKQYNFHKQKIASHRASMKFYESYLQDKKINSEYINSHEKVSDIRELIPHLADRGYSEIKYTDTVDYWLEKRIAKGVKKFNLSVSKIPSPQFLNSEEELSSFFKEGRKKYSQTSFYIEQRKSKNILLDKEGKPYGGKLTFDTENRKKYPAKKTPPSITYPQKNTFYDEAIEYVNLHFSNNIGKLTKEPLYPINFTQSKIWFDNFLTERFLEFGIYEDAIVKESSILNHSALSPMINSGLLTPEFVIRKTIDFSISNEIPLNSVEGFVRQIIGWREFIRGLYVFHGNQERTTNYWNFKTKIPKSLYDGTTGIEPLDITIKKILTTGYCHHIERLMILGNFMMLCEFDPDDVYRWFMELFIDAYDWVMVPNIYGMSQFSDGGLMATKPYISGSNYIIKMSNYKKGKWSDIWDGLFWNFMDKHRAFFSKNPRLNMLVSMFDKMPEEKRTKHLENASKFISQI